MGEASPGIMPLLRVGKTLEGKKPQGRDLAVGRFVRRDEVASLEAL